MTPWSNAKLSTTESLHSLGGGGGVSIAVSVDGVRGGVDCGDDNSGGDGVSGCCVSSGVVSSDVMVVLVYVMV